MPPRKSRFVLLCQQLLAVGTVAAVAVPAAGVVTLDIVGPTGPAEETGTVSRPVALVASRPVQPQVTEVPIRGLERARVRAAGPSLAALSAATEVRGFATVGVTWDQEEALEEDEITVSVRSREAGRWGDWQQVEYHDEHAPDPDSPEARNARQGTEPIVVGDVEQVQVRIETLDGEVPAGASLAVVDPGDTPAPRRETAAIDTADLPATGAVTLSSSTTGATDTADPVDPGTAPIEGEDGALAGTVGVTPKPQIFSRAQWGADERMRESSSLGYYEVHAGFVHHTVNANDYSQGQVPALLRGIYAYHTKSRGWSDIGYNFVVDRFGRIWEGRYGGVDRPVVGAHTSGYNEYSFSMSALGNFDKVKPSSAMVDAYGRLFAWKLSLHGVSAASTQQQVGRRSFPAVNGHRDAGSTACPGKYLYAELSRIRELAASYQAPFTARTRTADLAGSPWPDLVVREPGSRRLHLVRTGGQTNFQRAQIAAVGWKAMDLVAAAPDLTGDGIPDVLARDGASGLSAVHPGTAQGGLGAPGRETDRFADADLLVASPDLSGDGAPDVLTRAAGTTALVLHPGDGEGGFQRARQLSGAWDGYSATAAAGDLDGDGRHDLVARRGRTLYLVPGTGRGLGTPVALPGGWGHYSLISGAGDLTHDGNPDLVVKVRSSRQVFIVPGDGAGGFGHPLGPFRQLRRLTYLAAAGQLAGDPSTDLVGRDGRGRIVVFPNNGARNLEAVTDTGVTFRGNLILNVGDWDGDGFGDIMTRAPRGRMDLRRGNGSGGFAAPVAAAHGWGKVDLLAAVGDITGDGYPDLMGQPEGMAMRIYPGDGASGFLSSYVAHSAISSDRHTGLGLWDADGSPDSLLRRSDGALVLYRGNGPGGLLDPTQVGTGTTPYDWLQAVGDATGDGRPDLVGRERATGRLWLLPGTRKGFGARRLVADDFAGYDLSS